MDPKQPRLRPVPAQARAARRFAGLCLAMAIASGAAAMEATPFRDLRPPDKDFVRFDVRGPLAPGTTIKRFTFGAWPEGAKVAPPVPLTGVQVVQGRSENRD